MLCGRHATTYRVGVIRRLEHTDRLIIVHLSQRLDSRYANVGELVRR